jgi:transcriptional regulator with XRE-family HTH domain
VKSSLRKQFASFLKAQRGETSLRDFAKRIGLSSSQLHRIETVQHNSSLDTVETVLKRLKVGVNDVFKG